ncbi:transglycosylase [Geofilum sp. OHC36d9]|uniref:transglycosylase n=1 Tax=Geofilum sp. OHC36d9 TaxID=3458413 RepID=UPI004033F148
MKNVGVVLLILGVIGLAYFGYEAYQQSGSFNAFGVDVAVSKADWTPVILSALVTVAGYLIMKMKRK